MRAKITDSSEVKKKKLRNKKGVLSHKLIMTDFCLIGSG
jgi:hypothetical protein